jgi:ribonuclease BN (tRNA processing enzyme)
MSHRLVVAVLFQALLAPMLMAQQPTPPARSAIVILGDGTPLLSAERSGTSIGIVVRGTLYVFDAGPGVLRRIHEARERLRLGIQRLGPVFVTHLHSDHTLGLPELLYYPFAPALNVYGPLGIKAMLERLKEAWTEDRQIRGGSGMPSDQGLAGVVNAGTAYEVPAGHVYSDSNITVTAFEVAHGTWPRAFGYRIVTPDRVIVLSGDTSPSEAVVTACNGCDVLLHAVYDGENNLPGDDLAYFTRFHTNTRQLGELATRARPGLLILYHQLFMGKLPADLVRQVAAFFKGPVMSARDLDVY